jgi:putative nucleotidyltransferase with HDIG domain
MDRAAAYQLLTEYVTNPGLVQHMLAVEAAMRYYARRHGADEETWGVVGLLHDFDYERWPTAPDHPLKGSEILRQHGYPEEVIYAILSHADYLTDRYPRVHLLDRALYACDELAGFVVAVAKVQPEGLRNLAVASVRKKMKSKGFAAKVSREDIERGAAEFGVPLDEHIGHVIAALQPQAAALGLPG